MIPKLAIEKAIEGGMSKTLYDIWRFDGWEPVALKATFWQALGTACGLGDFRNERDGRPAWEWYAITFVTLILQGKDTTEYWTEILK